jgi:hypothetical protein
LFGCSLIGSTDLHEPLGCVLRQVCRRGDAGYAINDLRAFSVVFA